MPKTQWEARTGLLLRDPDCFAWAYKPADSKLYGGQARIDWIAADMIGRFWGVEVKSASADRLTINLMTQVSAGQREALDKIAGTTFGVPLLVVGRGSVLHVFDWRYVRWLWEQRKQQGEQKPELQPLIQAPIKLVWTGEKGWKTLAEPFFDAVVKLRLAGLQAIRPITLEPPKRLPRPASSASTSKPGASIPTPGRTLRLVR